MITPSTLRDALAERWDIVDATVTPHDRGMNSRTWLVGSGGADLVAKAVPLERALAFEAGLAVATHVEASGIPAGTPIPTRDGHMVIAVDDEVLALLRFVGGVELTGTDDHERRLIGSTLGRVHRALDGVTVADARRFHWLDPAAPHLDVRGGVRTRVTDGLATWARIPPTTLSWGLVHSDPAPEAFRFDASSETCGVIDWDQALVAPRMYDVASAVMYLGGPAQAERFLVAYLAAGPLTTAEIQRTLLPMLRVRWAVQADYFARRLADDDRTGITDPGANEHGLDDALSGLDRYRDT